MKLKAQEKSELILGFLMAFSINFLFVKSMYFEIGTLMVSTISFFIWCIAFIVVKNYSYIKRYITILSACLIILLSVFIPEWILYVMFYSKLEVFNALKNMLRLIDKEKVEEFISWSLKYSFGFINEVPHKFDIMLCIIIFALISLLYAYLIFSKKDMIYFILPTVLFICGWFRYLEDISRLFNIYFIALIVYYIIKNHIQRFAQRNNENLRFEFYRLNSTMFYGTIIVIVLVVVSNMVINFISVSKLSDKISDIFPPLLDIRSEFAQTESKKFFFESTPYQPLRKKLGGSINEDDRYVMTVRSNKPLLYLRGRVKNIYTGFNWYSNNNDYINSKKKYIDIKNIEIYDRSELAEVTIYPKNIETSTIFAPYLPIKIIGDRGKVLYNSDLEMYFKEKILSSKQEAYTVLSILPKIKEGKYNIKDTRKIDKNMYLQLPESLPARVKKLAVNITVEYKNDYDKMKALEKYLRENYTYSLIVSDIPEENDFVDYFLFEDKKGYCTYYASSLAVMGRAVGIPTRYVEGFVLPKEKSQGGVYEVTANMAHAWVEAYIDDIGWVAFEPTVSYATNEINENTENTQNEDKMDFDEYLENRVNHFRREELEDDAVMGERQYYNYFNKNNFSLKVLIILSIIFLVFTRILYIVYKNNRILSFKDVRNGIIKNYYIITSLYSYIDNIDFTNYSPQELLIIMDKNILELNINNDIIDIVNKSFYSLEKINVEDINKIIKLRENMEINVREMLDANSYYYHKYFKGNMYNRR